MWLLWFNEDGFKEKFQNVLKVERASGKIILVLGIIIRAAMMALYDLDLT